MSPEPKDDRGTQDESEAKRVLTRTTVSVPGRTIRVIKVQTTTTHRSTMASAIRLGKKSTRST
jgi:hypothetical protein